MLTKVTTGAARLDFLADEKNCFLSDREVMRMKKCSSGRGINE